MEKIRDDQRIDWPPQYGGSSFGRGDEFWPGSGEVGTIEKAEPRENKIEIGIRWRENKYTLDLLLRNTGEIFVQKLLETIQQLYGRPLAELGDTESPVQRQLFFPSDDN